MPEAIFDTVVRNKNGGVVFHNSSRGVLATQYKGPMTKLKIGNAHCTFQYKGPDGSSSCDKALDLAKIIALSR